MSHISVRTFIISTRNCTALSQTSFLINHLLLTSDVYGAYQDFCNTTFTAAKISIIGGCRKATDCAGMRYARTYPKFFFRQDRFIQLALLQLPCFLGFTKNEKIGGLRLSIPLISCTLVCWHGIQSTPYCSCLVSTKSIALLLVKNVVYKMRNCVSSRLVMEEISKLRRIPTSGNCFLGDFLQKDSPVPSSC